MTAKERVLTREYNKGREDALKIQNDATKMSGTELNAVDDRIPSFQAAIKNKNMQERAPGFVCKTTAGHVVRLLEPYDSDVLREEPEYLTDYWRFIWSKDPSKAQSFIAVLNSPYMIDECCSENGVIYASNIDNNMCPPSNSNYYWRRVGLLE